MTPHETLLTLLNVALLGVSVGALYVVSRLDRRAKDEAERLYQALPPTWQTTILRLIDSADALVKAAREVTDGQPNQD
ncbi:MAG: hypothetical protein SF162_17075 [bacterium]|nr:hypothetical protein [bacterium]